MEVEAPSTMDIHLPDMPLADRSSMPQLEAMSQLPRAIPAARNGGSLEPQGRTIVVCLDGTGDKFDSDNSNIVQLVRCLKKDDMSQQTYYQTGIGTYTQGGLSGGFSSAFDMAVGSGLGDHIRDAYHFLMQTYKEGDRICMFGFSRGAYTARCLAGMVHKVGLLPPRNETQIPFAYSIYKNDSPDGWRQSAEFKRTFCVDARIYFLGVFDSVSSVGVIPRQLPLSSTPWSKSKYFRHAMSLDEHRIKFNVCRFQRTSWTDAEKALLHTGNKHINFSPSSFVGNLRHMGAAHTGEAPGNRPKAKGKAKSKVATETLKDAYERTLGHTEQYETDVREVWFAGSHSDVGGGAVKNEERHKLSQIPLRWMIRQTFECDTGIIFNTKALVEVGMEVQTLWPKYEYLAVPTSAPPPDILKSHIDALQSSPAQSLQAHINQSEVDMDPEPKKHGKESHSSRSRSTSSDTPLLDGPLHGTGNNVDDGVIEAGAVGRHKWGPEQMEDYLDSLSSLNDQLVLSRTWWILEALPLGYKYQKHNSDDWAESTRPNWGQHRAIEETMPSAHWTVKHRINDAGYRIKARTGRNASWKFVV